MGWGAASAGPLDLFKMTVAEGGIRSPLLITGPGIRSGDQFDAFAYVWGMTTLPGGPLITSMTRIILF